MSQGKQGDKPSLPRNCKGNESPLHPLSYVIGWEGRQVGRPESGDPGTSYLQYPSREEEITWEE